MHDDLPLFAAAGADAPRPDPEKPKRKPRKPRKPQKPRKQTRRAPRDPEAEIQALREVLPFLAEHDQRFGLSLIGYFDERGDLSPAQWRWARKLPARARRGEPARPVPEAPPMAQGSNIVQLKLSYNGRLIEEIATRIRSVIAHGTPQMVAELRVQEFAALERMNLARGVPRSMAWQDAVDFMACVDCCLTESDGGQAA